jgi:hypothetical protein
MHSQGEICSQGRVLRSERGRSWCGGSAVEAWNELGMSGAEAWKIAACRGLEGCGLEEVWRRLGMVRVQGLGRKGMVGVVLVSR